MTNVQRQAAFLGAVLLIISFATGGLLAMAMTGKVSADAHGILSAHLNALFGCFWLCAVAFTLPLTRFGETGAKRLVWLTAAPAYGNWIITVVEAFLHVLGVGLNDNASNNGVFAALNVFVVLPSFASAVVWAYGLAKKRAD